MACSCRVENILTLSKLLRLWFGFLLHLFYFYISNLLSYIQNNFSYELARPIMGTIFLVNICGSVCIPGAKHGMLELIPQTLFFFRARERQYGGRVWVPETNTRLNKNCFSTPVFHNITFK